MIRGDVVFLDTETTGLLPVDEVWEVSALRRHPDGTEVSLSLQVRHNRARAKTLPDQFRLDYEARFDWGRAYQPYDAAACLETFLAGRPHLVGVNPAFDAAKLEKLFRTLWGRAATPLPPWHYHLIDLVAMTVGHQVARGVHVALPVSSEELSASVGVPVADPATGAARYARHTAMGDVAWVRDWYDALTGRSRLGKV